ncbi:SRSO17 transposase [Catenulispora sp. GAS73]|uniref:transposase n=1 Tax=Catenulispora sp. GAS73 TaxID=3156269 RepID=UPI003515399D
MAIVEDIEQVGAWQSELESLLLRLGERFARREPRLRMRDYVRGLLAPVSRKNGWQLAEYAGHATPDGLQRLLAGACWDADAMRDDVRDFVAERLGEPGGVLIVDNTGFIKKGVTSAGVARGVHRHVRQGRQLPDRRVRRLRLLPPPGADRPGVVLAEVLD